MLGVLGVVAGWPLARTFYFAFTDTTLGRFGEAEFVGLANFVALAADPDWWGAVRNTLLFTALSVSLETALGVVVALVLDAHVPGRGLLRAAILVPWAIPTVISAQMWNWMYNDLYGVLNTLLVAVGVIDAPRAWTADPGLALFAIVAVDVWKTTPFVALLVLAALKLVPREVHEAALVDGAPPLTRLVRVTLPLIRGGVLVAVVFRTLDALRVFDQIYVLTRTSRHTASIAIFARQQLIDFQDVGYGSAASVCVFVLVALAAALYVTVVGVRGDGEGARP